MIESDKKQNCDPRDGGTVLAIACHGVRGLFAASYIAMASFFNAQHLIVPA
jgi:hypothetical protein